MKNSTEDFLTSTEEKEIIEAIQIAEKNTSGEIKVHLEATIKKFSEDDKFKRAFQRAQEVFQFLHIDNTKHSNGVLIYIAVEEHVLVILGDKGINNLVGDNFWEQTKDLILTHFKKGELKQGLITGILNAGEQLKKHFPYLDNDTNELPDSISIG